MKTRKTRSADIARALAIMASASLLFGLAAAFGQQMPFVGITGNLAVSVLLYAGLPAALED